MSDLHHNLVCLVNNTTYEDIRASMKLYAERNKVAHADINELARTKQWLKLADRIAKDLATLETEKFVNEE